MKKSYYLLIPIIINLIFSQSAIKTDNTRASFSQIKNVISSFEILEITGTTGKSTGVVDYENKLPEGWKGKNTRLLNLEIQYISGHWYALGFENSKGRIASRFDDSSRQFTVYFPNQTQFYNRPWRAIIMKVK